MQVTVEKEYNKLSNKLLVSRPWRILGEIPDITSSLVLKDVFLSQVLPLLESS